MDANLPLGPTLMWTWEQFRCEHWPAADSESWLVLFHRGDEVLRRPLRDAAEAGQVAADWLRSRRGDTAEGLPEPARRRVTDRRKTPRGGRRDAERQRQTRQNES